RAEGEASEQRRLVRAADRREHAAQWRGSRGRKRDRLEAGPEPASLGRKRGREDGPAPALEEGREERLVHVAKALEVGERADLGRVVEQEGDRASARVGEARPEREKRAHRVGAVL